MSGENQSTKPSLSTSSCESIHLSRTKSKSSNPYFENKLHSWVINKTPPAPEALTSTTTFYSSSFDIPSSSPTELNSNDSIFSSLSKQRPCNSSDLKPRHGSFPSRCAPSTLRSYTLPAISVSSDSSTNPSPIDTKIQTIDSDTKNNNDFIQSPTSIHSSDKTTTFRPPSLQNPIILPSQRNSIASSNRDSIGSDMGYFSTSPGSEAGIPAMTAHNLTNLARLSLGPNEAANLARLYDFGQIIPSLGHTVTQSPDLLPHTTELPNVLEDGFHTARSSLYLTPLSFSPSISYSDLPRSIQSINIDSFNLNSDKDQKNSPQLRINYGSPLSISSHEVPFNPDSPSISTNSPQPFSSEKNFLSRPPSSEKRDSGVEKDHEINICEDPALLFNDSEQTGVTNDIMSSPIQMTSDAKNEKDIKSLPSEKNTNKVATYPPNIQRRLHIALEILQTERTYVAGLELIERVFYRPLIEAAHSANPIIDSKRISDIFSNLMGILTVNREFLNQLELRLQNEQAPWSPVTDAIGDIFCQMAPYFRMYSLYVKNFNSALSVISDQMGKTPAFAAFLKARNVIDQCKGLPFESYLIFPVQRIPRYKLLIEDLLKRTDPSHCDYANLVKGFDIVQRVATFVNETIRQHEMYMEMLQIQNSLVGFNEVLLIPGRRLIKRGSVLKICRKNHQSREFFLFTDILVYASGGPVPDTPLTFHRKVLIELSKVVDVEDTDQVKNSFQIINPEKSFAVYCNTVEEKKAWIDTIKAATEDLLSSKRTLRLAAAAPPRRAAEVVLPQVISNYQAPVWIPDDQAENCHTCREEFTVFRRKHHCRLCGNVVCHGCSANTFFIPGSSLADLRPARACDGCFRIKFPGAAVNTAFANSKRASFLGSIDSSSSMSSGSTLPRFPFNAPRRLAELRDSFISRDSYCSETSSMEESERNRSHLRFGDESSSSSNTSTFTRLQRLRSMSGSTAALVAGLQSNAKACQLCLMEFTVFKWKNECRTCRKIVCGDCLSKKPRANKRESLWIAPALPNTPLVSGASSVIDGSEMGLPGAEDEDAVLCDPCYLGVDPAHVRVNPEGGGWGVHEATPLTPSTPTNFADSGIGSEKSTALPSLLPSPVASGIGNSQLCPTPLGQNTTV